MFGSFLLPGIVAPFGYLQTPEFQVAWKATGVLALWPLGIAIKSVSFVWLVSGRRALGGVSALQQRFQPISGGRFLLPSATNPSGLWALWQKLGAWTGALFELFVREELLPHLPANSVLVLDIHHGQSLEAAVEEVGHSLLYLPPYSSDLNPIELVWSWPKAKVRALAPAPMNKESKTFAMPRHYSHHRLPVDGFTNAAYINRIS